MRHLHWTRHKNDEKLDFQSQQEVVCGDTPQHIHYNFPYHSLHHDNGLFLWLAFLRLPLHEGLVFKRP
jgi:hypothetical protein